MKFSKGIRRDVNKLNTGGCCLLCLKTESIDKTRNNFVSVGSLFRHLRIKDLVPTRSLHLSPEYIEAELCKSCEKIVTRFSLLYQQLEKVLMEMNYSLERIHQCVSESAETPHLAQIYSKRMTSDPEAALQREFVDNLRKELEMKSLSRQKDFPRPRVHLERASVALKEQTQLIKEESVGEEEFKNETVSDISLHSSPPPSELMELPEVKIEASESPTLEVEASSSKACMYRTKNQPGKLISQFSKDSATGLFRCNKCNKKFRSASSVRYHYESLHLKQTFLCVSCNKIYAYRNHFLAHKKICQQRLEKVKEKEKDPEYKWICKLCGKRFKANRLLCHHHQNVHRNDRYPCDICDKKFKRPSHLRLHRDTIHLGRRFSCRFCAKIYRSFPMHAKHEKSCPQKISVPDSNLKIVEQSTISRTNLGNDNLRDNYFVITTARVDKN